MVHEIIEEGIKPQLLKIDEVIKNLEDSAAGLRTALETEDSKRREQEMKAELRTISHSIRDLRGERESLRATEFKRLLAVEYDFAQTHPKFDKVYAKAYDMGHAHGYSEIEIYFSDFVDLVK